jgi:hypothetical protein
MGKRAAGTRHQATVGRPSSPSALYEIGAVARAHGVPRALLKSWCEQGILQPATDARGTGSRRWFDRRTAIVAGVLVEVRRLLGPRFRPGELAPSVAELDEHMLDRRSDPEPVGLVVTRRGDKLGQQYMALTAENLMHVAKRHSAFVIVNLTTLTERLATTLGT